MRVSWQFITGPAWFFHKRIFFIGAAAIVASGISNIHAETLQWNRSTGTNVAGYRIFHGESGVSPTMIDAGNTDSLAFTSLVAGRSYFFYAKAYNVSGAESVPSPTINYTKPSVPNQPPNVQITSPANGASYTAPATIVINANATDTGGTVTRVDFYNGSTLLGSDTTAPYSYTMSGASAGGLALTVRATDNSGLIATSSVVNVTVANASPGVYTVNGGWLNVPFANQTGTFTAEFDAVPSVALIDSVIALSSGSISSYTSMAAIVRFNRSGTIDARNSGTYTASSSVPYSANVKYHFRLVVSVPTHTYSVYVTPAGGTERLVASNFQFRTEQSTIAQLSNLAAKMDSSGTVQLSAITVGTGGPVPNQPPTISTIANQTIFEDSPSAVASVTVGDPNTALSSLVLSASSSNPGLIPNGGFTFGGSGASRTVNFRPTADQSGSAVITTSVSDGEATASTSFTVTVAPVNDVPSISNIADQSLSANQSTPLLAVAIADKETAAASLTLTAQSSNPALVPQSGLVLGGSAGSRTIRVTPAANQTGQAVITVVVSDGASTASDTFTVTVGATLPAQWATLNNAWMNMPVANQFGVFTAEFDAIPSGPAMDAIIGFSNGSATSFASFATIVRFNPAGLIDVRDRGTYVADTQVAYAANVRYHFRLGINVTTHTYSVYVTPQGGTELTLAADCEFRTEQLAVTQLNNLAGIAQTGGTVQVSTPTLSL